jgi:hypothetical protein
MNDANDSVACGLLKIYVSVVMREVNDLHLMDPALFSP